MEQAGYTLHVHTIRYMKGCHTGEGHDIEWNFYMTGIYPRRLNVTEAKSPNHTYQVIVRPIMHNEDSKGISENIRWREIYVKAIRLQVTISIAILGV